MNIRTLCLGILFVQNATGYEINKLAEEGRFSHFIEASYGSIYPTLTKLTKDGLVTWREEAQPGKPSRKIYSITEEGRKAFINALYESPKPDIFKSEFLFICLYFDHLDADYISSILDQRIAELEGCLQELNDKEGCCDHLGSRFAIGYGRALTEAAINYVRNNRTLLEGQSKDAEAEDPGPAREPDLAELGRTN